jgi:hypothetical protein
MGSGVNGVEYVIGVRTGQFGDCLQCTNAVHYQLSATGTPTDASSVRAESREVWSPDLMR